MGREELLVELTKYKKLKAELKEMVECPVGLKDFKFHPLSTICIFSAQLFLSQLTVHRCA